MKKNIILAGLILLFAACSNENDTLVDNNAVAPVRVHANGFTIAQEEFSVTRAT